MNRNICLLVLLILSSCRYFNLSPVNGISTKDLIEKPAENKLIGIWEVDNFSYDLIRENGYEIKKVELEIKKDGSFEARNLPDFIEVFEKPSKKYVNTKGSWTIEKDFKGEKWVLTLSFEKSELYKGGMTTSYDLYLENNEIIIWSFIGDPDSGERFLYRKE